MEPTKDQKEEMAKALRGLVPPGSEVTTDNYLQTVDYWRGQVMQRDSQIDELRLSLEAMLDTVRWMSGSNDFGPEGQAWEGWQKVQPDIDKAQEIARKHHGTR